jgi:kinesin family protein C1
VKGLTQVVIKDPATVKELIATAGANRAVAATTMNARSSRSHSVFRLKVIGKNKLTGSTNSSLVNLVDLAGSERLLKFKPDASRLKETQAINKSLATLGAVIMALGNKESHIPFRNSKLTFLLQPSLAGHSKCLMFANVSADPACAAETLCSLRFAATVKGVNIGTAKSSTVSTTAPTPRPVSFQWAQPPTVSM